MNKSKDFLVLACIAYKEGQFEGAAKLFSTALETEGLDTLVDYISKMPEDAALTTDVGESNNTLSPSLRSESSADLASVIDTIEAVFRSESSMLEDGDELMEQKASNVPDAFANPASLEIDFDDADHMQVIASAGPVSIR